ncbi:maleylpyruvate isomerase N-terminal domain-containing protein, partial [Mycobacterium sp.]|uniref:maleylpyruvate isomerase N-terminal domain-containing protein n=1 Tax=Mycobacterium sp. TaxID=1785 RepID=UPI0031CE064F
MTYDAFQDVVSKDGRALIIAAESNWVRPVPDCPDWDAAGLVRHTGGILAWIATIVETGEPASFGSLAPSPEDNADLSGWFLENLDRAVGAVRGADPEKDVWTFSSLGDHRVSWWRRRLAVEMVVHRADLENAVAVQGGAAPSPLDGAVAVAGIEEFVT